MMIDGKTRILFFIGSLRSGGKERRLIELLTYLHKLDCYELLIVVTRDEVHYPDFYDLQIPYMVIDKKKGIPGIGLLHKFYKICKIFQPHLIHSWGRMQTFYSLPAVIGQRIPLVNSQITAAPPNLKKLSIRHLIDKINFNYSNAILPNSRAGLDSYNPPIGKTRIIYNGINLGRFDGLPSIGQVKKKYGISTPFVIVKVASFTPNKDYDLFLKIATKITAARKDITFIGVGDYDKDDSEYNRILGLSYGNKQIQFPGKIHDVEALVNASDIGVLFTNQSVHGEGISNAILEYMSLSKPVIANDAGGTKEILRNNVNGFLIMQQTEDEIINTILELVNDPEKCRSFGNAGRRTIEDSFTLDKMGIAFERVYQDVLNKI